jgi:C-terminal processing protease CtpA/Prc
VEDHLFFGKTAGRIRPFSVRRIGDTLFVVQANPEAEVSPGEEILALDGKSIPTVAEEWKELLYGECAERQDWGSILGLVSEALVKGTDGICRKVSLSWTDHREKPTPYEFRQINSAVVLLRLNDFADGASIGALVEAHRQEISQAETLILDLRQNAGGSDTAFLPLLPYCLTPGEELPQVDGALEINYTERTVDLRLNQLEAYGKHLPPEYEPIFAQAVEELKKNRGKGFVPWEDEMGTVPGTQLPRRVYVLSDYSCASSGEAFVERVRGCKKVTVVGRPTEGILDYSNCVQVTYGSYWLQYPTSRRLALDRGISMAQTGIPVDFYIPFSPAHLSRDVDLEQVLKMIEEEKLYGPFDSVEDLMDALNAETGSSENHSDLF